MDKSKLRLIKARTRNPSQEVDGMSDKSLGNATSTSDMESDTATSSNIISSTESNLKDEAPDGSICVEEVGRVESLHSLKSIPPTQRPPSNASAPAPNWAVKWTCGDCGNSCIPVRSESRCLCGHRYKEHKASSGESADRVRFGCSSRNCPCKHFFFIVAEGAWILRCRCKHKHIEHDCGSKPFVCKKAKCACSGFDSPWVCNCGHPWSAHHQSVQEVKGNSIFRQMMMSAASGTGEGAMSAEDAAAMMAAMDSGAIADLDMDHRRDGEF